MIRVGAEQIIREYQLSGQSNSASNGAVHMTLPDTNGIMRLLLEAEGDAIVFNFGLSTVVASNTVSGNKLTDGNFTVAKGAIIAVDVQGQSQSYVDVINVAQASGATAYIRVCALPF